MVVNFPVDLVIRSIHIQELQLDIAQLL